MNKLKDIYIRISAIIVAALVALTAVPMQAVYAAPDARADIDLSRKGSLTLTHTSVDGDVMEGVTSHIYLVATIDENGRYTLTDAFKGCFEDPDFFNNDYSYDEWKSCVDYQSETDSDKLLEYIKANDITEAGSKVSGPDGKTCYTDLALGVYYVLSDKVVEEEFTHIFTNFVYPVPILEKQESSAQIVVNYDPSAAPKKARIENEVETHCHILKRWEDAGHEDKRPESVDFAIYCDDEFMRNVTLSNDNDWYYEWSQKGVHSYKVEEISAGEGYTGKIKISHEGTHFWFTCTNTYKPQTPPPEPEEPPTPQTPDEPSTPGIPDLPQVLGAVREMAAVLGARRLPQTGQLWWPLPILVLVGIVFIVKGIRKNNKNAK